MPVFAKELERFGFRTTVVMGQGNPENKTENVLPGIKALNDADVAIFFTRFLKLPDDEWKPIEDYLKSGKPVIGLRTANHAFKYPKDHPRYDWNDDFGRRALGTPYIVHQGGTTDIKVNPQNAKHPIMTNVAKTKWVSPGTLYLARLEKGCLPLITGSGKGRARLVKKRFGEIQVKEFETATVAFAWETLLRNPSRVCSSIVCVGQSVNPCQKLTKRFPLGKSSGRIRSHARNSSHEKVHFFISVGSYAWDGSVYNRGSNKCCRVASSPRGSYCVCGQHLR